MHPSCRPERHNPYVLPLAPKHRRGRRPVPLIHAPRLRHLDLEPLGHVASFPPGFLSGSPQLRYLNLDATGVSSLQPDFLGRHPHLETVRLRAQNMTALPRCFLAQSPNLMDLKLGLQRVEALPEGWLAETPRLWNLEIDVHGIEALPAGFLAHAPRIRTLGLAMPLLEPTLTPEHRLWETLQTTSLRVKVTRSDPVYFNYYDYFGHAHPECRGGWHQVRGHSGGSGARTGRPRPHTVDRNPLAGTRALCDLLGTLLSIPGRCRLYGTDARCLRCRLGSGGV